MSENWLRVNMLMMVYAGYCTLYREIQAPIPICSADQRKKRWSISNGQLRA